jgi:hypothetical protein
MSTDPDTRVLETLDVDIEDVTTWGDDIFAHALSPPPHWERLLGVAPLDLDIRHALAQKFRMKSDTAADSHPLGALV